MTPAAIVLGWGVGVVVVVVVVVVGGAVVVVPVVLVPVCPIADGDVAARSADNSPAAPQAPKKRNLEPLRFTRRV